MDRAAAVADMYAYAVENQIQVSDYYLPRCCCCSAAAVPTSTACCIPLCFIFVPPAFSSFFFLVSVCCTSTYTTAVFFCTKHVWDNTRGLYHNSLLAKLGTAVYIYTQSSIGGTHTSNSTTDVFEQGAPENEYVVYRSKSLYLGSFKLGSQNYIQKYRQRISHVVRT